VGLDAIGDGKPCAELWMGTHPNGPSEAFMGGKFVPLLDLIHQDPEWWIGKKTRSVFGDDLPFLLKVSDHIQRAQFTIHSKIE
jgi:mannose-6-phosphate isomerase